MFMHFNAFLNAIDLSMPHREQPVGALPDQQPGDQQIAAGVFAREAADGRHLLFGAALANCPKLLRRVLQMQQLPGQLMWRSSLSLTAAEWGYIKRVFAAPAIQPLLQQGRRVLTPLPGEAEAERGMKGR